MKKENVLDVKTYMNLLRMFILADDNGDDLLPISNIIVNENGSYSFIVQNMQTGEKYKHTIITEEL